MSSETDEMDDFVVVQRTKKKDVCEFVRMRKSKAHARETERKEEKREFHLIVSDSDE